MAVALDDDYKRAKEAFFADLHGTSAREVFALFAIMPGTLWLYSELMLLLEVVGLRPVGSGNFSTPVTLIVEFSITILPMMISFTFAELALPLLVSVYCLAATFSILSWQHAKEFIHKHCRKEKMNQLLSKELPFLTNFRAQVMLSTCFAILAVDFTVFPRRFAKTETFGFSVMDIGVGAFIVSAGIASSYARKARPAIPGSRSRVNERSRPFVGMLYAFFRPIVPVLVLGTARFLTVKGVNYQEHVSEYGVHWNFFFTLAGVYLVYSSLQLLGSWAVSPISAAIIMLGYQLYLSHYDGEEFILNAPRDTLFSQNREGILSLAGYTTLYLLAVYIGRTIFSLMDSNGAKALRNMRWLVVTLFAATAFLVLATYMSVRVVSRPSRRMVNLSYVLWVLAETVFLLGAYAAINVFCMLPRVPVLFQGVNRNQLFVFLLANLATGAVNLSIRTIETSELIASGVLMAYMFAVCTLSTFLERANLRIKL